MRIDGEWSVCDDGILRPIIRGEIQAGDGSWRAVEFLVDTGADRTVLSANVLQLLYTTPVLTNEKIGGVGGIVESVALRTKIRFNCENANKAIFRGTYAACVKQESLDISVLGRDIMSMFAVIVDQPENIVALIREKHLYTIEKQ